MTFTTMKHKYVYVVTEFTSNNEADADIKVYNSIDSANKDYKDRYFFYTRVYDNQNVHIYTQKIIDDVKYNVSTIITFRNGSKITLKLVKTPIK